jgi:DNA-binding PadR family transcriptional regulator
MPLQHAVLALLAAKPAHGYELRTSFEEAVGDQWGGMNIGHLYQVLDRLARDGLITSERQPQPVKPDRVMHQLTPAGRAELDRWLSEPSVRQRGYRDDFFLKVMAAARLGDPDALTQILRRQRSHLLRELRGLTEAAATAGRSPVDALLITAAERHVRADLEIVDAAEATLGPDVLRALAVSAEAGGQAEATGPAEAGGQATGPAAARSGT